jgi:hypothetical protein
MAQPKRRPAEEAQALEAALSAVDLALERLLSAEAMVGEELGEGQERVAMPNSRRAEHQLRTAVNATLGAQRSLRRRLELRRTLREGPRPVGVDEA